MRAEEERVERGDERRGREKGREWERKKAKAGKEMLSPLVPSCPLEQPSCQLRAALPGSSCSVGLPAA